MLSRATWDKILTGSKGEHVGQCPGQVKDDVKLSNQESHPPSGSADTIGLCQGIPEDDQTTSVEGAENGPDDELRMAES